MPRRRTDTFDIEGDVLVITLQRAAGGGIGTEIVVVETDLRNGVPSATRRRILSEDLAVPERNQLWAAFNAVENRIKARDYS